MGARGLLPGPRPGWPGTLGGGIEKPGCQEELGRPGCRSTRAGQASAGLESSWETERHRSGSPLGHPGRGARARTAAPRVAGLPFWRQSAAAAHLPLSLHRPREGDAAGWSGTAWTRPPSGVGLRPLSVLHRRGTAGRERAQRASTLGPEARLARPAARAAPRRLTARLPPSPAIPAPGGSCGDGDAQTTRSGPT